MKFNENIKNIITLFIQPSNDTKSIIICWLVVAVNFLANMKIHMSMGFLTMEPDCRILNNWIEKV